MAVLGKIFRGRNLKKIENKAIKLGEANREVGELNKMHKSVAQKVNHNLDDMPEVKSNMQRGVRISRKVKKLGQRTDRVEAGKTYHTPKEIGLVAGATAGAGAAGVGVHQHFNHRNHKVG